MILEPVDISDAAAEEIHKIMTHKNIGRDYALRVAVKGMGCGVGFRLGFDKFKEGDIDYEKKGVKVLVSKRETMYLLGLTVDFYEGSDARGFVFVKEGQTTGKTAT